MPAQRGHAAAIAIRAGRRARTPASAPASSARPPVRIGAHAGTQLWHLVDRIGADRERPQVEVAGGAGGAPARILALGGDELDLDGDTAIVERRNVHAEAIADLQRLHQIL